MKWNGYQLLYIKSFYYSFKSIIEQLIYSFVLLILANVSKQAEIPSFSFTLLDVFFKML